MPGLVSGCLMTREEPCFSRFAPGARVHSPSGAPSLVNKLEITSRQLWDREVKKKKEKVKGKRGDSQEPDSGANLYYEGSTLEHMTQRANKKILLV
jgi:hypothetical protein